ITNGTVAALHDRRNAYNRVIPSQPLADFVIKAFAAGLWVRNKDFRDHVTGRQNVFVFEINLGKDKEFFQWNYFLSRRIHNFDLGVERNQDRRQVRRVDDKARAATKNCMIAAVARNRITELAALSQAVEIGRTKIPTKGTLAEIAADS